MDTRKKFKIAFWVLLSLGVVFLVIGIVVPIEVKQVVQNGIDDLWMKPDQYSSWGETPGKIGANIIRQYNIFNVTNPEGILQGEKPQLVQIPSLTYKEYAKYKYWEYQNETFQNLGQDNSSVYLAYNYNLTLPRQETLEEFPFYPDEKFTLFNGNLYILFYAMTHQSPVFYALHNVYDVKQVFETDLYSTVIAYSGYQKYLYNETFAEQQLKDDGLTQADASTVARDASYGWGSWASLKLWIDAYFQYQDTQNLYDGGFDIISNYFQVNNLSKVIGPQSYLASLISEVQTDMQQRYGTSNRQQLGMLQWSNSTMTLNLPLGIGPGPNIPSSLAPLPVPSFLGFNATFNYIPEIKWLLTALEIPEVDLTPINNHIFQTCDSYPMNNTSSLLNLTNIGTFFTLVLGQKWSDVVDQFKLTSYDQITPLATYVIATAQLPIVNIDGQEMSTDNYGMILARYARRGLVNTVNNLKYDSYWSLHGRMLYYYYLEANLTCSDVISRGQSKNPQAVCTQYGWDIKNSTDWMNIRDWYEAAVKSQSSDAYQRIMKNTNLTETQLDAILYGSSMKSETSSISSQVSSHYGCSKNPCIYSELFYPQWGESKITNDLPDLLSRYIQSTLTFKDWFPDRYYNPGEFYYHTSIPIPTLLSSQYLTYNAFLNATPLRLFFNYYFSENYNAIIQTFAFPSEEFIRYFYDYLLTQIPGFSLFQTRTYLEVVEGYIDPFFNFVYTMSEYEGGYPAAIPFNRINGQTDDSSGQPKHVINSGKNNSKDTRQYVKYYGTERMNMYTKGYNAYGQNGLAYDYYTIWGGDLDIKGSDGGQFGTNLNKEDEIIVYISSILRYISLKFKEQVSYKSLTVYKYVVTDCLLKTTETCPENEVFYQYPNGFNGLMNLTSEYNAPVFIGFPHCYSCEGGAESMADYYAYYKNNTEWQNYPIIPSAEHDEPYGEIEPMSGAGVSLLLNFQVNTAIYKDYYYKSIYEPVTGKGLYMPYYTLLRTFNYTKSMIDDNFKPLIQARQLEVFVFYVGIIFGSCLILLAIGMTVIIYKLRKQQERKVALEDDLPEELNNSLVPLEDDF